MTMQKGVDVSWAQGEIDWAKVKGNIDFAIIRGGYGKNNTDSQAIRNIKGCQKYKIPYGLYWFSYALSQSDSVKEADYVCDMADQYGISLPVIGYDWEEDSEDYAKKNGVTITDALRFQFASAFLKRVQQRGYTPLLYTNYSDLDRGYKKLTELYDVWFANPGGKKPSIKNLAFWQYSWTGKVSGVNGDVDLNECCRSFSTQPQSASPTASVQPTTATLTLSYLGVTGFVSTGDQVKTVQRLLNALGYKGRDGKALTVDGIFGGNTEHAVIAYQKKHSLDADGVVGPVTWKALTGAK